MILAVKHEKQENSITLKYCIQCTDTNENNVQLKITEITYN